MEYETMLLALGVIFGFLFTHFWLNRRFVALVARFQHEVEGMHGRLDEIAVWQSEHVKYSNLGKAGQEIKQENAEMRQAALNEGRELLAREGMKLGTPEGLDKVKALVMKYPKVAESVARTLNREFGISQKIGMSENTLLEMIASEVAKTQTEPQQNNTGWNF